MTNFHSSGLRQKVDQLMDILWSGGVNNPMDAMEQISYLLFLRLLSEKDEKLASLDKKYKRIFSGVWAKRAWGNFVTLAGNELFDAARSAMESLHELPGLSATGRLLFERATLKIYDRPSLRAVIQAIHEMDLAAHDGMDLKGDMYEYLLSKIAMSGTNGQFRTPRHIINMIVEMVHPQPGERICDPACGTAGFLVAAFQHILRTHTSKADLAKDHISGDRLKPAEWKFLKERAFTGFDNDANMVKIAILNLYLHQLEKANIEFYNPLTTGRGGSYPGIQYDVILANPPFSGSIQQESILSDLNHGLNTRNTELLFLKWFIDHLAKDGRAGIIVPEGVVLGTNKASRKLRQMLIEQHSLEAVISLPHYCFKPYASVATFVLIINRKIRASRIWMYKVETDGFSPDSIRTPISESDIPDLLKQWHIRMLQNYKEQPSKHGWVPLESITSTDYELAPRRFLLQSSLQHQFLLSTIGELCTLSKGRFSASEAETGDYPMVTTAEQLKRCPSYQFEGEAVCIPLVSSTGHGHASIKRLTYIRGKFAAASIIAVLQVKNTAKLLTTFLYYFLESHKNELLVPLMKGTANVSLTLTKIAAVEIPIPPIRKQQSFCASLNLLDQKLTSARTHLESLTEQKQQLIAKFKYQFDGN